MSIFKIARHLNPLKRIILVRESQFYWMKPTLIQCILGGFRHSKLLEEPFHVGRSCGGEGDSVIILSLALKEVELTLWVQCYWCSHSWWLFVVLWCRGFAFGFSLSKVWVLFLECAASTCSSVELSNGSEIRQ